MAEASTFKDTPYIWEGRVGEAPKPVKPFDMQTRATLDREVTERTAAFITRSHGAGRPFFAYVPFTLIHFPTLPHPEFAGKTGAGDVGDAMAEMDRNVGVVLDTLRKLGIERNTIVIWASDGGAEARRPWRGTAGPWRGSTTRRWKGASARPS
jgi:arylsulfatase